MSGFTPGPWEVSKGCDQYIGAEGLWIASTMGVRGEQGAANARLIAAAPQMADALAHYADQLCEGWCEQSPDCAHFDDCGGCLARRVHFQATGTPLQAESR